MGETYQNIFLILILLSTYTALSQAPYDLGYRDGFKAGYCYNEGLGCIAPIPPIAPPPSIGESEQNYFDGYNRGLIYGSRAKLDGNKSSNSNYNNSSSLAVYGQQQYVAPYVPWHPDWDFYQRTLEKAQQNYEQLREVEKNKEYDSKLKQASELLKSYYDPKKVKQRVEYVNLLKLYYNQIGFYPKSIPDGVYKTTITSEPNPASSTTDYDFDEDALVKVENNKVVFIKTHSSIENAEEYIYPIEDTDYKNYEYSNLIFESFQIQNAKGKYIGGAYIKHWHRDKDTLWRFGAHSIYFFEYINKYNDAQKCIKETKKKYASLTKFPKAQDGWNIIYANDGVDFCDVRKVFVENGKITIYKGAGDIDHSVTSGGNIVNGRSTISFSVTWKDGTHPKTLIEEIYFQ